jgi:Allophanate hydrolase C-terminal domain
MSDFLVARAVRAASRVPQIGDQHRRPFSVERVVESCSANKHAALAAHAPGSTRAFVLRSAEPKENALNVRLAVNGTLMRGLALNGNLLAAGATFVRETTTGPSYRLWSIGDRHPAMMRVASGGAAIAVEVWDVPAAGLASVLLGEPAGLCVGKVRLADGEEILGVLGEPILCEGQREITEYGGWRAYVAARGGSARA